MTSKESFYNTSHWLEQISASPDHANFMKVLVGCKIDQEELRKVSKQEGASKGMNCCSTFLAKENDMLFFETSALKSIGIDAMFQAISKELLKRPRIHPDLKHSVNKVLREEHQDASKTVCQC